MRATIYRRLVAWLAPALAAAALSACVDARESPPPAIARAQTAPSVPVAPRQAATTPQADPLPAEARQTLRLIDAGGPFPYPRDGITFQNRERQLPIMPRGYYREYTVPTPGRNDRGARRIVTGGTPPTVFYYTEDHYRSFVRINQ